MNTDDATGWCLEPYDLAFSKLVAGREKDFDFISAILRHQLIRPSPMERLIGSVEDLHLRERLVDALRRCRER